ncbi:MAG: hypothetical protein DRJ03_11200 [Chloroflexi bacterium]|nr:MAG: hypothetical protein B6I35_10775 [Anaerolineaceae bacterium 4572_32.2]RLC79487.1 MAG: hypothetical protein DRI81_05260 [Chloroflexota bacterium]RLC85599.1 MAG: hypothetical protein DRJ03_11200 [Chloroflexota bacterium]HEY71689.1 hypothetical protein [Thermoflexia bacterium]
MLNYPLNISFKIAALAPQISVIDASGNLVFYVKQKLFKLKEAVTVFADTQQTQPLYTMSADRVLDFSARYNFADQQGIPLGAVKRQGMKSLWKARYDILDGDAIVMTIQEENPWVRVIDGFFNQIPIVGLFSGYMFHPAFLVMRPDETVIMRVQKQPAFFEGKFTIEKQAEFDDTEEKRMILSVLMMLLLERTRG